MKPVRSVGSRVLLVAVGISVMLGGTLAIAEAQTIGQYQKVGEQRVTRTVTEYTYRATLANGRSPLSGATATVVSLSTATTIVDASLTFGPADPNGVVPSADTFSFRHDRTVPFSFSNLQWTIVPGPANRPPIANAGPDQTAPVGARVTLDGSASSDADGNPLTFAWSLQSVPPGSQVVLSDPASVNPTFTIDRAGVYVIRLVVGDGVALSAPDAVVVSTRNSPPVANAGPDQTVLVSEVVTLDGSGSTDVDGDALTYAWSLTSRPPGSLATLNDPGVAMPTFVADEPGTYVAQLIVHDGQAPSAPDMVTINTQNSPPVANAGPDQTIVTGQVVLLDGTGSFDVDGDPLTFQWSFTSRPAGSTASLVGPGGVAPSFTADLPGTYVVQLIVNDGLADSGPDTVIITTTNSAPVANAGPDQLNVLVGETVTLDGSGSADPDGTPLQFAWALIGLPPGSGASLSNVVVSAPSFVADVPGNYIAQLIVSDGTLTSAPDTVLIRVQTPEVTLTATDADAAEAGRDPAVFTVTRTGPTTGALTVFYTIAGEAANGTDYQAIATSVTIPAGMATATITIAPIDDSLIEGTESAVLVLDPNAAYVVGTPGIASVRIADNDLAVVTVNATDALATEAGPTTGTFVFSRTGDPSDSLLVFFSRGGTAATSNVGPQDYANIGQSVTIPAGQTSATVTITPLRDNLVEGPETATLTIDPRLSYVVGTPDAATVTIADDPPVVSMATADAAASEAGPDAGAFTFTRAGGNLAAALTVLFRPSGTAANIIDYANVLDRVTIPANQTSTTVTIAPLPDNAVEGVETAVLTIDPSATYVIGAPSSGTVSIADDPPVVNVTASDPTASETGPDPGVFTIMRSGGNLASRLLVVVSRGGTANNGSDYASLGGGSFIVAIPANQTSALVTVVPIDDAAVEGPETVELRINASPGYVIGAPGMAVVTIADND